MQEEKITTVRLILGDQLHYGHSWYKHVDSGNLYVLMEVKEEAAYVVHHAQKVIGIFAAMYNFSTYLRKRGHRVLHLLLDDPRNKQSITANLDWLMVATGARRLEYQLPDEYRLDEVLKQFAQKAPYAVVAVDTEHFLTTREAFTEIFGERKQYLMETFYRKMRQQYQVLLQDNQPLGGKWNYDHDNRKAFKGEADVPPPLGLQHNYSTIWQAITSSGIVTIGAPRAECFDWPTTRKEALCVLDYFVKALLPHFGMYQDAMHTRFAFLFHSRLSFALNIKLIGPLEVIRKVEAEHHQFPERVGLEQAEGFIRQVLGWREYVRGLYWKRMPVFGQENYFNHQGQLPKWYWTGETKMNCLKHAISQTMEHAYAHHIQRLMVTGNFALLAGVHPDEVDKWYLGVYIDAFEWVELPNTRGMSQYADGGVLGSKPYVSAAAYIDKMSNYCKSCFYAKSLRYGDRACPFNSLYWNFYLQHYELLKGNHRIAMMIKLVDKMDESERQKIRQQANHYLENIDTL
jgi:deoxyribodipyrimidine photolyase-related protein